MNKVILMGRLTRDPEIRYSQGNDQMAIARYTLAVDRRLTEMVIRPQILLTVLLLAVQQNLLKSI